MTSKTLLEWSKAVRQRDGKCVRCGSTEELHAHHIKRKSEHPELALEVSNGETLCKPCHDAEHKGERFNSAKARKTQRRTMEKTIGQLQARIEQLEAEVFELKKELGRPSAVGKLSIFDKRFYIAGQGPTQ